MYEELWALPHTPRQKLLQDAFEGLFRIGPMLDRGGVAEVYLVSPTTRDASRTPPTSLDDHALPLVLKVLRPLHALDQQIAEMFVDEIKVIQQLNHPGIVRCIEGNPTHHPPYLLLEFIPGCHLGHLFDCCHKEGQTLHWSTVWELATGLAETLAYLHTAKTPDGTALSLIHRDLSPPNILIGLHGEVRLTDFGIAIFHNMSRATSGDEPKGKFSYLAPEMLLGLAVDQRADIFSWGVIVWELLTGHRLFEAQAPEETLKLLGDAPILRPQQLHEGIPQAFEDIVMHALTRDREQRYPNTRKLLAALQTIERPTHPIPALAETMQELAHRRLLPPHVEPFARGLVKA